MPGLSALTGVQVLTEIGLRPTQFATVSRASGNRTAVLNRRVKYQRLASAGCIDLPDRSVR